MRALLLLLIVPLLLSAKGMVVGYMPDYRPEPSVDQLKNVTHLVAFSLQVTSAGGLTKTNVPSWLNSSFVTKAHDNGAKVIICVGGWGRSDGLSVATSSSKATFISNLTTFVTDNNLDGVDLDWEFPSSGEMSSYGSFLTDLKKALGSDKYLSIAVGAGHNPKEFPASVFAAVDAIHLMAYDMGDSWPAHSDYAKSIELINNWWSYGSSVSPTFKKEKLVLGVPFYTRGAGVITYAELIGSGGSTAANSDTYGGYDYNGIPTIQKKTADVYNAQYGGIMIWELAQDLAPTHQYSLLKAINAKTDELGGYSEGKAFKLTVTAGLGGKITPSGTIMVDSSKSQLFTITPDQYFIIDELLVDGKSQGAKSSFTLSNVVAEHSIVVSFKKDPTAPDLFTLTTKANANGTITPLGSTIIPELGKSTVKIAANSGYVVDYVKIDNVDRGPICSIAFSAISADHSVEAFFKKAVGGDLGKYEVWTSSIAVPNGDTVAWNDSLWKYQGSPTAGGWGSSMTPSISLASSYGTPPWLFVGLYNDLPDTLITATATYASALDGSDTLTIKTDSSSGGKIYGTNTEKIVVKGTAIEYEGSIKESGKSIAISGTGRSFFAPVGGNYSVSLFDLRGRELYNATVFANAGQTVPTMIDQGFVSRGVYLVQVRLGSVQMISRIQR